MHNFGMTIGVALASILLGTGASAHGSVERSSERWAFFAGALSAGVGAIVAALRPSRRSAPASTNARTVAGLPPSAAGSIAR